jgi:hypothetical protein
MPLVAQICANVDQFVGGVYIAASTGVHAHRLKTVNKSAIDSQGLLRYGYLTLAVGGRSKKWGF